MMNIVKVTFFVMLLSMVKSTMAASSRLRGGAELLNEKAYQVELGASLFSTTAYFDDTGKEVSMLPDTSYRLIDTDLKISYGIAANFEASLFSKFRSVNSNDGTTTASKTGPESAGAEFKYALKSSDEFHYALGVHYRQTLYTNTVYTTAQIPPADQVILGDDGSEYGVDFYATYLKHRFMLDIKIGYNSPPNDLSSEIVYRLEGRYHFTKLALFAGLDGIHSLKRDQYTDTPMLKPLMSTGQTHLFNSLNREIMAPYVGGSYAFNKFIVYLKGQSVVSGRSTDKGNLVAIGLTWSSQGISAESVKIDSFKEYHIEGSVLKVSARGNFIKIDQGLSSDVEKGSRFDIYQTDYFGGNVLVAAGIVHEVGSDWAVIKLVKKYKDIEIKPGFAARGQ